MTERIPVAILGATGAVGQRFVQLLSGHPWFEIAGLAASERSAGQRYADACRWVLDAPMPAVARDMPVLPISPNLPGRVAFSALPGDLAGPIEEEMARAGFAVCSNASAHRMDDDVPLIIPEVNPEHIELIARQRRQRGWTGFIATNPNCTATVTVMALAPLMKAFGLRRLHAVSLQALSGAGYPGVPSLDILGNVVPYIKGEEEKMEAEIAKMLGKLTENGIVDARFEMYASCARVPVIDGHLESVVIRTSREASAEEAAKVLREFRAEPQRLSLPTAPEVPIIVREELDRPQPHWDVNAGSPARAKGMAVTVGRVRKKDKCIKLFLISHNTLRGGAGGSVLNAELACAKKLLG